MSWRAGSRCIRRRRTGRAVFTENGQRRYRQAATEAKLAAKLAKVTERLSAGAASMEQPGADLIAHYLDPGRLPVQDRWSRKHAHTQRRLCERFAAPVIGAVTCQDITTGHTQQIVNAAPTAGEGDRVQGMISALVAAGIEGGYLTNPRLAKVHWQAGKRPLPAQRVTVAGESGLWVDPAEIPADDDIGKLGQALAEGRHGERDELMASTAAYSGLRWGELTALTIPQIDTAARVITVDRKVVEIAGHLYPLYRLGGVCLMPVPAESRAGCSEIAVSWTTHNLLLDRHRYGTYGGTQQIMNAALGGILRAFGYAVAPFGSGGAWLVTGRRGQDPEAGW